VHQGGSDGSSALARDVRLPPFQALRDHVRLTHAVRAFLPSFSTSPPIPPPLHDPMIQRDGPLPGLGDVTCETLSDAHHASVTANLPFLRRWDPTNPSPRGVLRTKVTVC